MTRATGCLYATFLKHPRDVCMTYVEHCLLSLQFAAMFASASVKAVAHAFVPSLCVHSTSDTADAVQSILLSSGCRDDGVSDVESVI